MQALEVKRSNDSHVEHWADFLNCIRTRGKPVCDIETAYLSTATAILGNMAVRSGVLVEWDTQRQTTPTEQAKKYMRREYRAPWKLEV